MPRPADRIPENINYAARELLEAAAADRPAMLENIARPLTRRLLKDEPGIGSTRWYQSASRFSEFGAIEYGLSQAGRTFKEVVGRFSRRDSS